MRRALWTMMQNRYGRKRTRKNFVESGMSGYKEELKKWFVKV
jgi:hypothetical protein